MLIVKNMVTVQSVSSYLTCLTYAGYTLVGIMHINETINYTIIILQFFTASPNTMKHIK